MHSLNTHTHTLYIRETKNTCRARFSQHKHKIITQKDSAISNHFNQPDHNILCSNLQSFKLLLPATKALEKTDNLRKKNEIQWIRKLHTYTPHGLNTVDIPLILPFSDTASHLAKQIKTYVNNDNSINNHISVITSFSNHKNLQNILAPTKFN